MESRLTVWRCWDWSWSWGKYLISSWNRWIIWRISWNWNPDTISLSIRGESTCTRYLWIFIWNTVSFSIREIFTWTSRRSFKNSRNAASWSITNKSSITYYRLKCYNTISISITFVSTWTYWMLNNFRRNINTSSVSIKNISLSTCK